jgi:endonuclease/exonuclease/phosphatase family metal-dependent hydrolase
MTSYRHLSELAPDVERRTIERILGLRRELDKQVPRRSAHQLLLATWNIREFDSPAYGDRGLEPLHYIAEIVSHFDLVAVAEVRSDLAALERLMDLLGSQWRYLVTDVTSGSAGNDERLAVLYDSETVSFGGLSGELVVPPVETKDEQGRKVEVPAAQFARTPLLAGFRSEWLKFMVGVLHVRWGDGETAPEQELRTLVQQVTARNGSSGWAEDLILLGDFNIGSPEDTVWEALRDLGWTIPPDFAEGIKGSNIAQDKFYDQIALRPREHSFELSVPGERERAAGVFNYFDVVYRAEEDFETYVAEMKAYKPEAKRSNFTVDSKGKTRSESSQRRWYRDYWRTHQMSDHLPLWVSLRSDYADDYLAQELTKL